MASESEAKAETLHESEFRNIGFRIRVERRTRKMRLKDLADTAGCSESLLSRVENGLVIPSLTTLHRLCRALGISVTALLNADSDESLVIYRNGERPKYSGSGFVEGDGSMAESLVPYAPQRMLEAHIMHVPSNGDWCGPYRHAGEEVGYVLEGALELKVNGTVSIINVGDSFFFESELEHFYRASGDAHCRIIWVNTPVTF
ncbi:MULTISPECIES: helix-turn-helix domain-containing protein [Ancylobacter]|uniref:Transcriptional regulator with XRE-family HTH domain n=2 Tax=Ancylobacter TaxID=99 RepID=A0A839ZB28_9HYPH|nr:MULTISPECIES: cupin domain-containing protein [Ancylobacter]MBB3771925.1 transcriptional regulator with XRE-family HTH domain [Ancylobacter tetraedralis]MDQ0509632.1 transcriptional regulator with XRE-family HTH domain [Ancylobacter amanitiformis]